MGIAPIVHLRASVRRFGPAHVRSARPPEAVFPLVTAGRILAVLVLAWLVWATWSDGQLERRPRPACVPPSACDERIDRGATGSDVP